MKCLNCGHIFEDGEELRKSEKVGEFWGAPAYEEYPLCPLCESDEVEETCNCEICGGEFTSDELCCGVCDDCISDYQFDLETCYNIGKNAKEPIEINSFLTAMFSVEEIEKILIENLRKSSEFIETNCADFINSDKSWFAEQLIEEVKR